MQYEKGLSMSTTLADRDLAAALAELRGWTVVNGKLHREFQFKNFVEAFGFMTTVALIAERLNHHPEWSNVYHRVVIDLVTHDAGGITSVDVEFARAVNRLLT
jgi:4a-hydroxytetrahydrobiopterin dehydratase